MADESAATPQEDEPQEDGLKRNADGDNELCFKKQKLEEVPRAEEAPTSQLGDATEQPKEIEEAPDVRASSECLTRDKEGQNAEESQTVQAETEGQPSSADAPASSSPPSSSSNAPSSDPSTEELGANGLPPGLESGIVKWYDITRGFGFIQREAGGEDVFIHQSSIPSRPGQRGLADKEPVWFRIAQESQDRWRAFDITGPHGAPLRGVPDGVPGTFGASVQHAPPAPQPVPVPPTDPSEFPPHTSSPLSGNRQRGVAKWFNLQKGFGFIAPEDGSEDVFCHQSNLLCVEGAFRSLAEKENLEFEIVDEANQTRAKRKAINVTGPGGRPVVGVARPPDTSFFAAPATNQGVFYPNHPAFTPDDYYGQQYQHPYQQQQHHQPQYQHNSYYQQQQHHQQRQPQQQPHYQHQHFQHEQPSYQSQFQHQYQHQPAQPAQQQQYQHQPQRPQSQSSEQASSQTDPSSSPPPEEETEAQYAERQAAWRAYYEQLASYQQQMQAFSTS